MLSRRRCDICKIDVHLASFAKDLRSKKHLENFRQLDMIMPDCLFTKAVQVWPRRIYNHKPLKQPARVIFKLDDKHFKKEVANLPVDSKYMKVMILVKVMKFYENQKKQKN